MGGFAIPAGPGYFLLERNALVQAFQRRNRWELRLQQLSGSGLSGWFNTKSCWAANRLRLQNYGGLISASQP